jgi:hypothetical protein
MMGGPGRFGNMLNQETLKPRRLSETLCGWSATLEDSDSPLFLRSYSWPFQRGHRSPFLN